jgi:putative DNA primase/helicase
VTWSSGARYFHPEYGLRAGRLADDVQAAGPLMIDTMQGKVWAYADGVWTVDQDGKKSEVRRRVVKLLGERYRPSHGRTVMEVLGAHLERFTVGPRPALINLADGLLRWRANPDPVLLEHNAEEPSTVQLPVTWQPDAPCREFEAFLAAALPADDIERAWELLGYLMMSGNPLQRMFLLSGSGGNGKGVFMNVARALLGSQNFSAVNIHALADDKFAAYGMYNKLANICGEIDSTFIEKTGRIKELSGDDPMTFEQKGEDGFTERWWGKALFSANSIPGTSDASVGWSRRWEVIQFPYAPTKPDPDLSARIVEHELPGIAYRAVMALRQLMSNGHFSNSESRENAHREFADKANKVRRWLDDPESGVTREETGTVFNKGTTLLKAFRSWEEHDSGSRTHTGVQRFNDLCRQAGLQPVIKRGTRGYYGAQIDQVPFGIPPQDHVWINYSSGEPRSAPPDDPPEQGTLI